MNKTIIAKNYAQMEVWELKKLVKEAKSLREEFIPVLKNELLNRNEILLIEELEDVLKFEEEKEQNLVFKDDLELEHHVKTRLARGEHFQSVIDDLKDNNIDILSKSLSYALKKENLVEEIAELKYLGISDKEIEDGLAKEYDIDSTTTEELNGRIKKKSKNNITVGVLSITIGIVFILLALNNNMSNYYLFGFIPYGVYAIYQGIKQQSTLKK